MNTLKLSFLTIGLAFLAGCPTEEKCDTAAGACDTAATSGDTDTDTDTDADGDTDTDTDADADTASYVTIGWKGSVQGDGTTATRGSWGFAFYDYDYDANTWGSNPTCTTGTGLVDNPGAISATCDNCEFSYSLLGDASTGSDEGAGCADALAAAPNFASGAYDGFGMGAGATSNYGGYGIAAMYLYLADYPDNGWFTFTLDYAPVYSAAITGGTNIEWGRVIIDQNSGYPLYYEL